MEEALLHFRAVDKPSLRVNKDRVSLSALIGFSSQ